MVGCAVVRGQHAPCLRTCWRRVGEGFHPCRWGWSLDYNRLVGQPARIRERCNASILPDDAVRICRWIVPLAWRVLLAVLRASQLVCRLPEASWLVLAVLEREQGRAFWLILPPGLVPSHLSNPQCRAAQGWGFNPTLQLWNMEKVR